MSLFTRRLAIVLTVAFVVSALLGAAFYHALTSISDRRMALTVAAGGYLGIIILAMVAILPFRKWLTTGAREDFQRRAAQAIAESRTLELESMPLRSFADRSHGQTGAELENAESVGRAIAEVCVPCGS